MSSLRSVTAGGHDKAVDVASQAFKDFEELYPRKLYWFAKCKYIPHEWQAAFHTAHKPDGTLCRYRHLAAGRRGGKTMSAARDVLFYCLHPEEFHMEVHGKESTRALWVWVLTKDHEVGRPSRVELQLALNEAGLTKDQEYKWNKTEKLIEFSNGSILQFRSAEDPESLRGAGLDILWIDEAAHIPNNLAYNITRPALSDKLGIVITTTTPKGKNWLWEEFWSKESQADPAQFRVEYTYIDNPYNHRSEWEEMKKRYHPLMFKQEFMASFEAMTGVELPGDWLHYYTIGDPGEGDIRLPTVDGKFKGRKFIGVDPASSLSDQADYFAMVVVGLSPDGDGAYILDTYRDRIPFPDQLDKIREWFMVYRPEYIGVESNAYQRVLAQQASRMQGLPPIVEVNAGTKKAERIMSMSPSFKYARVRLHRNHRDFIDEWLGYDTQIKNPRDDLLDATEIALRAAGVILPLPLADSYNPYRRMTIEEEARAQILSQRRKDDAYDSDLGSEA